MLSCYCWLCCLFQLASVLIHDAVLQDNMGSIKVCAWRCGSHKWHYHGALSGGGIPSVVFEDTEYTYSLSADTKKVRGVMFCRYKERQGFLDLYGFLRMRFFLLVILFCFRLSYLMYLFLFSPSIGACWTYRIKQKSIIKQVSSTVLPNDKEDQILWIIKITRVALSCVKVDIKGDWCRTSGDLLLESNFFLINQRQTFLYHRLRWRRGWD